MNQQKKNKIICVISDTHRLHNNVIIPKCNILVTHCPPYGILDRNIQDERCGCEVLQREIYIK